MILSIRGFKSIQELREFKFSPLTMLTGINSSGKTSLIQTLLLLKQTLESETKEVLRINGKYISTEDEHDLVRGKQETDQFEFVIELDDNELSLQDGYRKDYITHLKYKVDFHVNSGVYVHSIDSDLLLGGNKVGVDLSEQKDEFIGNNYQINLRHLKMMMGNEEIDFSTPFSVSFSNFFPDYAFRSDGSTNPLTIKVPYMEEIKTMISSFFSHIYYVGPLRVKPDPIISYTSSNIKDVGADGKYTRFVLHNMRDVKVNDQETLIEATHRWICNNMKLAESLVTTTDGTNSYRVILRNRGLDVDLCHMGLGVSQVLPIIVQGLLVPKGGMLIVDSPEVHMHPSIQAVLVDFFIELSKSGRFVVIETHSDHIITRLRRRVAEGLDPKMINLCFVSDSRSGSTYKTLDIDDKGYFFGSLPPGFMDTQDEDFREIVKQRFNTLQK